MAPPRQVPSDRTMSYGSVELVRRSFEAFVSGDFDTAFASFDSRAEWRTADDEPDSRTYRGIEEVKRWARALADPWADRFDRAVVPEEYIDLGDWVVVPTSGRVHGRGSGIEVNIEETYAVRVRGDRIVRVEEYRTKEQALEAVRVSSGAGPGRLPRPAG
jgi:ketosteroid isomerase-like protein